MTAEETEAIKAMNHIEQFFTYTHLPPHLQTTSEWFAEVAEKLRSLPANRERTKAFDLLLAAKDAAVRAKVAK